MDVLDSDFTSRIVSLERAECFSRTEKSDAEHQIQNKKRRSDIAGVWAATGTVDEH